MRRPGYAAPSLLIFALVLLTALAGVAPVAARQNATPPAGTPAPVTVQPTAPAAETPAAAATPAAPVPVQTDVVTLVLWYANAPDGDIINLFPLLTDAGSVAGPASGAGGVGTADFPEEDSPSIVVGDTTFETYPRADGVIERWTWFDDFEGARPGTLVMQISGLDGTYTNFFGTATFVSRDEGGAGGVLTIVLRPPDLTPAEPVADAAPAEAPADAAPADDAAAEPAVDAEAVQPDVTAEPGTEILDEPAVEGDVPVESEEVPAA